MAPVFLLYSSNMANCKESFAAKYRNCTDLVPVIHLYRYYKFEPARMRAITPNQCFLPSHCWSVQFLYLAADKESGWRVAKASANNSLLGIHKNINVQKGAERYIVQQKVP